VDPANHARSHAASLVASAVFFTLFSSSYRKKGVSSDLPCGVKKHRRISLWPSSVQLPTFRSASIFMRGIGAREKPAAFFLASPGAQNAAAPGACSYLQEAEALCVPRMKLKWHILGPSSSSDSMESSSFRMSSSSESRMSSMSEWACPWSELPSTSKLPAPVASSSR